MHTNRRYELTSLGLKVLVLLVTMATIMGILYAMGNLECTLSKVSPTTKGKLAAVKSALLVQKSGIDGSWNNSIQEKKGEDQEDVRDMLNSEVKEDTRVIIKSKEIEYKEEIVKKEVTVYTTPTPAPTKSVKDSSSKMTETQEEKEEFEEVTE